MPTIPISLSVPEKGQQDQNIKLYQIEQGHLISLASGKYIADFTESMQEFVGKRLPGIVKDLGGKEKATVQSVVRAASRNYFSLGEMTRSNKAAVLGIRNDPTPADLERWEEITNPRMNLVREESGFSIWLSSGYRNKALTTGIYISNGWGAPKPGFVSRHELMLAADMNCGRGKPDIKIAQSVAKLHKAGHLQFHKCILEFLSADDPDTGWIHLSFPKQGEKALCQYLVAYHNSKGELAYTKISADDVLAAKPVCFSKDYINGKPA